MKSLRTLLAAIALLALASPALASSRQAMNFHAPIYEVSVARGAPVMVARASWRTGAKVYARWSNALALAERYNGGGNPTGFYGPWCKAFTNMILRQAGYHPGPSLRAIDGLADGQRVASPAPGDLAVMAGHITFFASWDGSNTFIGLGGNQGHMVRSSRFWRGAVIAWVRPS